METQITNYANDINYLDTISAWIDEAVTVANGRRRCRLLTRGDCVAAIEQAARLAAERAEAIDGGATLRVVRDHGAVCSSYRYAAYQSAIVVDISGGDMAISIHEAYMPRAAHSRMDETRRWLIPAGKSQHQAYRI